MAKIISLYSDNPVSKDFVYTALELITDSTNVTIQSSIRRDIELSALLAKGNAGSKGLFMIKKNLAYQAILWKDPSDIKCYHPEAIDFSEARDYIKSIFDQDLCVNIHTNTGFLSLSNERRLKNTVNDLSNILPRNAVKNLEENTQVQKFCLGCYKDENIAPQDLVGLVDKLNQENAVPTGGVATTIGFIAPRYSGLPRGESLFVHGLHFVDHFNSGHSEEDLFKWARRQG